MKKTQFRKAISFVLLIILVFTCNTGISLADTNTTYPSTQNLIEKLSHPASGEKVADGILPEVGGDRSNSYAWAMAQLGDYVYIGSNRNLLGGTFVQAASKSLGPSLASKLLDDISEGDIPTDPAALADMKARIFRYDLNKKTFEEIYTSSLAFGYRSALPFKAKDSDQASVYFGSTGSMSQVLRFDEGFKPGDKPESVYNSESGYSNIRAMAEHDGTLCIGVLTISSDQTKGNLQIMQSDNPAIGNWTEIASLEDFAGCAPRTDSGAVGQSGIWDMISYNGSLYAFIGTGYVNGSNNNGYCVFKGTKSSIPDDPKANKAGWVWNMIVGPAVDDNGVSTGAIYPRGMGNPYDGSASPFLYTDPSGKTYVYVGTFDSIFDSLLEILKEGSYESVYRAMHPAKIYRFDQNDNWEMVIGNPDQYFNKKLGNYYAGFSNTTAASIYSPNFYVWRMAQYNGELFAGTFDGSTLLDAFVPPLKIDVENYDNHDLLKILNLVGKHLPEVLIKALSESIMYADNASAAAISAQEIYLEAQDVAEAGDNAFAAADEASALAGSYTPGAVIATSGALYSALLDCNEKTKSFADQATAAAVNTTLAAATAIESQIASESASSAVTLWEEECQNVSPAFTDVIHGQIDQVRDDVSAAAIEAHAYVDQAQSEATAATLKAKAAEEAVTTARNNLIEVSDKLNKLLGTITLEQYSQLSELLGTLAEFGYGNDELQKLRYILELRIMINTAKEAGDMGCSVYRTRDGVNFTPVTTDGFNDKYNYGLRTFLPTKKGLFMGMANPYYGAQLWRLGDLPSKPDTGNGGGGGGGGVIATATKSAILSGLLNMTDHFAYIQGYADGAIRPLNKMTRAEAAAIFYRLLTDESKAKYLTTGSSFSDVSSTDWFSTAASTLANAKILTGYNDGKFHPDSIMSRAEFAAILARIADAEGSKTNSFTDISNHWAKNYISTALANGWVSGYSDNTFRPDQPITRAEVMTMVNRVLHRAVKSGDMLDGMKTWSDSPQGVWYYEAVQEATNAHNYELTKELVPDQSFYYEKWTKLNK